VFLLEIDLV
jgi:hypothetical protein